MKKNLFDLPESEKNRILEMHINRTSNHYLLTEQENECPEGASFGSKDIRIKVEKGSGDIGSPVKTISLNTPLKNIVSAGSTGRSPILTAIHLIKTGQTATEDEMKKGKWSKKYALTSNNLILREIGLINLIDKTNKSKSINYPYYILLEHKFCAKFPTSGEGTTSEKTDLEGAIPGSIKSNFYYIPINAGPLNVPTLINSGINPNNNFLTYLSNSFLPSNLGKEIPKKLFGDDFDSAGQPIISPSKSVQEIFNVIMNSIQ